MKLGLYAGTFNPFHKGHFNIYQKACKIFDKVVIAAGTNPEKYDSLEAVNAPSGVYVYEYYGILTTDIVKKFRNEGDVTLIRGIRNGYDYDYEMTQIAVMRDLLPDLEVILIPCDKEFGHISSTMIRNLQKFSKKEAERYLP